jgi:hypothetical protein
MPIASKLGTTPTRDVGGQLCEAEEELSRLQSEHGQHMLAVAIGEDNAEEALAKWQLLVRNQEALVAFLRLAHSAAAEKDRQTQAKKLAEINSNRIRNTKYHLDCRMKAAVRLQAAIENAVTAYEEMLHATDAAYQSAPIWPDWFRFRESRVRNHVQLEIYRRGSGAGAALKKSHAGFPGGEAYSLDPDYVSECSPLPGNIVALSETIKAENATIMALMTGQQMLEVPIAERAHGTESAASAPASAGAVPTLAS